MIIHHNEITEGMEKKEQLIEVKVAGDFTPLLQEVSNSINELNNQFSDAAVREQSFIVERNIHTAIIQEKTESQPLFDLALLGYTNVDPASIQYLYTPKKETVDEYVVDILTTYFEYEDETNNYQVLLPLYLVHSESNMYLLPLQGENELVQASLEKI